MGRVSTTSTGGVPSDTTAVAQSRRRIAPRLGDDRPSPLEAEATEPPQSASQPPDAFAVAPVNAGPRDNGGLPHLDNAPRVVWTRGDQCRSLAETIGGGMASQVDGDVAGACIRARALLLVSRQLTSFDLCNIAVPHGFDPTATRSVVAAVGSGPHSQLAATIAHHIAHQLEVPARAIYGYRQGEERPRAQAVLEAISAHLPGLAVETIGAPNPAAMVGALPAGALLVVGAPGGSWFQRQFFGPGARIQAKAPNGTIVVKSTPARIYQVMQPPTAFGPQMRVGDARQLAGPRQVIVAQKGQLLGIASAQSLEQARSDLELRQVMDDPVFLTATEYIDHTTELITSHDGNPVPVVDAQTRLIGTVAAADLDQPRLQSSWGDWM